MALHRNPFARRRVAGVLVGVSSLVLAVADLANAADAADVADAAQAVIPSEADAAASAGIEAAAPSPASDSALGPFRLTPEQSEKLRVAREAELRGQLGLAADAPIPRAEELTDAQRETLRAAREAEMRRVLGLDPDDPMPTAQNATAEQRRKIAAAHEARVRAALGLGEDESLFREPIAAPAAPAAQGAQP